MKNIKTFEVSSKKSRNGRRKFKVILHEIYPENTVDEINGIGTVYNGNGISWQKEFCEKALPTIKDMSLRVEFLNEDRDEICGHGDTGIIDGLPIFENADVVGHFTNGYIDEYVDDDGIAKIACFGEGYLDEMCYKNFVSKLEEDIENENAPYGSVEIYKTENNDSIKYKYGYKNEGRIPSEFIYSGFALLGIRPADYTAKILELNNKEDLDKMTDMEIKSLVSLAVEEMTSHTVEINKYKEECDQKIAEANELATTAIAEKNEIIANSEKIQVALDDCKKELEETYKKLDGLYEEMNVLREELGKAQAKERVNELNTAIAEFSEEEKSYAKVEIDAFNADPISSEINSVVNKIWEGIGKTAKASASKVVSEQNSSNNIEDIFGEVSISVSEIEDTNIF